MVRVRIVHWKAHEAAALIEACRGCGFEVEYAELRFGDLAKAIRAQPPDVLVIDLTRLPSHGRDTALALRRSKYARYIPLIFVDGAPEKVEEVRRQLPDATFTTLGKICAAIRAAGLKKEGVKKDREPIVPPGPMERYGARTVAQKLGIKPGTTVGLVDAPRDYAAVIGELPEGAELMEDSGAVLPVTLWFVRDPREYQAGLRRMAGLANRTKLWVVWRKGSTNGLTQYVVRNAAIEAGLVDYKICALGEPWSGMALAPRKS